MPRIVFITALALTLAACADSSTSQKHKPPQDPPDYQGVPTDTRPPVMLNTPEQVK